MVVRKLWLAGLQNTQFIVTTLTALLILHIRTAHSLWFGLGTLVAAFSAKLLKRFIRQPRPVGARKFEKTYGMPSTHSSSISFFGSYLSLTSLLLPLHPRVITLIPFYGHLIAGPSFLGRGESIVRVLMASFFLFASGTVCWSRVRLGHHTPAQVLVGAMWGSTVAIVWLSLWLGASELSTISRVDLSPWVENLPGWLMNGLKEEGRVWERAAEDALIVVLEAWETQELTRLKALATFPLLFKDEL